MKLVTIALATALCALCAQPTAWGQCAPEEDLIVWTDDMIVDNSVQNPDCSWTVEIRAQAPDGTGVNLVGGGATRISSVTIIADEAALIGLFANGGQFQPVIESIGSIDVVPGAAPVTDFFVFDIITSGDVGPVRATRMGAWIIGGDLASLEMFQGVEPNDGVAMLGLIVRGSITGDVISPFGGSITQWLIEGTLGAPGGGNQVAIAGDIQSLTAGEINADIDTTAFGASGSVGLIETTTDFGATGDFNGSLRAVGFEQFGNTAPEIRVAGKLAGRVNILESLDAPLTILADKGLTGQVIINGGNAQADWIETVTIGAGGSPEQVVLDPMNFTAGAYPDTPGELGGGSVGLAPFNQHMEGGAPQGGGWGLSPGPRRASSWWRSRS